MNKISIFQNKEFGSIRTVLKDNEVWFVARDLSKALGYKSLERMYDHIEKEDKKEINPQSKEYQGSCENGVTLELNPNIFRMVLINESGLYSAIFGSQLEKAKEFKRWVTSEVLPDIRKHGAYLTDAKIEEILDDPDTIIKLATQLKEERQMKEILALENKKQQMLIGELKPKVDYVNEILKSKDLLTITQIAKDYGMSAVAMNKLLHELKVQYKESGQWLLYAKYHDKGYTKSETFEFEDKGIVRTRLSTKWTQKGRLFLYELLKEHNYYPIMEKQLEIA